MNTATSLNMMVKMDAFEKMPKEGSITATELGALINLEPSVIGEIPFFSPHSHRIRVKCNADKRV